MNDEIKNQTIRVNIQATDKSTKEVQNFLISSIKKEYRDIIVESDISNVKVFDEVIDIKALVYFNPRDNQQVDLMVKINELLAKLYKHKVMSNIRFHSEEDIRDNIKF